MKPKTKTINLMLLDGGVGDHIASLVAVDYIIKNYPWITPLVWMPDFLVDFATNVLKEDTFIKGFSQMRSQYDPSRITKTTKWDGIISPMKIHCLDYAFLKLCDENPSIEHKNYLQVNFADLNSQVFDLPEKYIVCTTGFTADVREWPASEINKTATYIKSKGYEVVFLGQTQTKTGVSHIIQGNFKDKEIDFNVGINLIDKTSLLEAAFIMNHAKAVLGVDNGLLHLAGCTQVPIIGGFTTVTPEIRIPVRHGVLGWNYYFVVPDQALECKFCQQKTNFLYGHDYKKCIFKEKDKKNLCTTQMTSDKFIYQFDRIISKRL